MYKKILLTAAVGFMMVASPLLVSANSVQANTIQSQIQTLISKVQNLMPVSVVTTPSAAMSPMMMSPKACHRYNGSLRIGAKGGDVSALQQFLLDGGFSIPAGATGYFGGQTKVALGNWQVKNNIVLHGNGGEGIFGPMSRGFFNRVCGVGGGTTTGTTTTPTSTPSTFSFSVDPQSGNAPLNVTFTASRPITTGSSTFSVDFGDTSTITPMTAGSCIAITAIVGGQGGIRCSFTTAHAYTATGTYTARLMNDTCPANAQCFVGPLTIATTTIQVMGTTTTTSSSDIVKINAPSNVSLMVGNIAEIRNENAYFKVTALSDTSSTIEVTPVGCWNYFPSDTPPQVMCMIYMVPIPPVTLKIGESYTSTKYSITLAGIKDDKASFSITTH